MVLQPPKGDAGSFPMIIPIRTFSIGAMAERGMLLLFHCVRNRSIVLSKVGAAEQAH
jgi:hypothetical protein